MRASIGVKFVLTVGSVFNEVWLRKGIEMSDRLKFDESIRRMSLLASILLSFGMWGIAAAHENGEICDGTHAARVETEQLAARVRQAAVTSAYTCDLRAQFNQCRQYMIGVVDDKSRINELARSCQSLGGTFTRGVCPEADRLAMCMSVRFRKDVFYDASYYPGEPSQWTREHLKEVCQNLPGQFNQPE